GRVFTPQRHNAETGAAGMVDVPDHIDIIADLPNGAQATYTFSSVCGLAPGSGAWLFGSEGTLHFDQESRTLLGGRRGDKALQEIPIAPAKEGDMACGRGVYWRHPRPRRTPTDDVC